jgi:hypothetical protein
VVLTSIGKSRIAGAILSTVAGFAPMQVLASAFKPDDRSVDAHRARI